MIIIAGIIISHYIYFHHRFLNYAAASYVYLLGYIILFFAVLIFFSANHLYKYQVILDCSRHTIALLKSLVTSLIILIFVSFIFKITEVTMSRVLLGITFTTLFILFFISRVLIVPQIYYWLVRTKRINRNLLIVGAGELSIKRAKYLKEDKKSYFNICGFLDDDESKQGKSYKNIPVLGKPKDLKEVVNTYKIKEILISINNISYEKLQNLIELCKETRRTIHIISELYNIVSEKLEVEEIAGISAFRLQPSIQKSNHETIKRIFDVLVSAFIIIILSPIWIIIAFLIKITSKGTVFYKAKVIGKDGKEFLMLKFRSMYTNCSKKPHIEKAKKMVLENTDTKKLRNDPRITSLGKFLRKFSIDEFPQLWNVLKGDMSLVGPCPNVPYEYEIMDEWQKKRQSVLPGMTGIWQIRGRDEVKFNEQIVLDLYYIENRSLKLDMEILLKAFPVVLFGKGGV
jgi:undecaprenyl-phosphate galactose phosphotransferase